MTVVNDVYIEGLKKHYDPSHFMGILEIEKPTIYESEFVNTYLKLFVYREGRQTNYDTRDWLSISGTPYHPVEVLDDVTNEVLFTVPPLLDQNQTAFNDELQKSIGKQAYMARVRGADIPGFEDNMIGQKFASQVKEGKVNLTFAKQWNEIFKRYGAPLFPIEGAEPDDNSQETGTEIKTGDFQTESFF